MTTGTILPVAAGDLTECALGAGVSNWNANSLDDADASYVISSAVDDVEYRDLYNMANPTPIGVNDTITNVRIAMRIRGNSSTYPGTVRMLIKTHGALSYVGPATQVGSSYVLLEHDLPVNPITGNNWTLAELNDLQAGPTLTSAIGGGGILYPVRCTYFYLVITYIEYVPPQSPSAPQGPSSITPTMSTNRVVIDMGTSFRAACKIVVVSSPSWVV